MTDGWWSTATRRTYQRVLVQATASRITGPHTVQDADAADHDTTSPP